MIKKSFRLMLLVAFALSSVMFVACNKYDDDIDRIDQEIASLQQTVQSLQSAISGGAVVTGVNNGADGVTFTMSNGQSYTVKHGTDGKDGQNGANGADGKTPVITIDPETNNWVIDGVDTGVCAKGAKGDKGDKGDTGAQGPAGTNGTNGTNGTDGKDGQNGKDGLNGYSPKISEDGFWMVYDDENQTWVKTDVVAAFVHSYVVDCGSYYVLNVIEHNAEGEDAGWVTVKLPKTAVISDIKAVSISKDGQIGNAVVTLNYGKPISVYGIVFNGKPYAGSSNLVAAGSKLSAIINPISVDASMYEFSLVDSKGNAPYVLGVPTQNMTEAPLTNVTRADATPNRGAWDMTVQLNPNLDFSGNYGIADYAKERSKAVYALTTTTVDGVVASAYDVKVTEQMVVSISEPNLKDLVANLSGIDLSKCFVNDNIATVTTSVAGVSTPNPVDDLTPYIVDYYFTIADNTIEANNGVVLNGNTLSAAKPCTVPVYVHYLLVDGQYDNNTSGHYSKTIDVTFTYTEQSSLQPVEWTITNASGKNVKYLNISSLQSLLAGNKDGDVPYVRARVNSANLNPSKVYWQWADEADLDTRTVVANGLLYGEAGTKFAGNEDNWIATIANTIYRNTSGNSITSGTSGTGYDDIHYANYVKFTFKPGYAFPGEYLVTLDFWKGTENPSTDVPTVSVPVKVVIKAPEASALKRMSAYFDGDNAVAYGVYNSGKITFNLFDLFEELGNEQSNVSFAEVKHTDHASGYTCAPWISSGSNIAVLPYKYGTTTSVTQNNKDAVYSTRTIKVTYKQFNNDHIEYVKDQFELTVKSEIAEGTLDATSAAINITNTDVYKISLKNVVAKDVYGDVYVLANQYPAYYDSDGNITGFGTTANKSKDSRVTNVEILLADDNAKEYLALPANLTGTSTATVVDAKDGFSAFQVTRKQNSNGGYAALTSDVTCTLTLRVTDQWGRRTTSDVVVTLKKN